MSRWRVHVFCFFFPALLSVQTNCSPKLLFGETHCKTWSNIFAFKMVAAISHTGKQLTKRDAPPPRGSLNNESPFSEMKTEVCDDVMHCYKPKTEPVPVPRKSISKKNNISHILVTGPRHRKPKMVCPK